VDDLKKHRLHATDLSASCTALSLICRKFEENFGGGQNGKKKKNNLGVAKASQAIIFGWAIASL